MACSTYFSVLPEGLEECRYVKLIGREGFEDSDFEVIVPSKRRRNCYRIDDEQMFIEMSRGRSDIYDVLTHLTFMYNEAEKIKNNAMDHKGRLRKEWKMLEAVAQKIDQVEEYNQDLGFTYLSTLLGRSFDETIQAYKNFNSSDKVNSIFKIAYWLGKRSIEEHQDNQDREISFSRSLREKIGHHIYGEVWASNIKKHLKENSLIDRPIHIISSNMHSVLNCLYAHEALKSSHTYDTIGDLAGHLSQSKNKADQKKVKQFAAKRGLTYLHDDSGTNISVQVIDCAKLGKLNLPGVNPIHDGKDSQVVIIVMDYAFGEQAYETMDELLKPYEYEGQRNYTQHTLRQHHGQSGNS